MSLLERLQSDLLVAMRAGDAIARETLRLCLASLRNRRIEVGRELDEGEELQVLSKAVKTRLDAAGQYQSAGRGELAEKERAEVEVIRRYLPPPLSDGEVRAVVEEAIAELGIASEGELGRLMKAVMGKYRGRVDGRTLRRIAGELLG